MADDALTPEQLRDVLAGSIAGVVGGSPNVWRQKIGVVMQSPREAESSSNWSLMPMCGTNDHRLITDAAEAVRASYPYVAG